MQLHGCLSQVVDPTTRARKPILMPCSGEAVPGEIVAIIGPSGAGAALALLHRTERG